MGSWTEHPTYLEAVAISKHFDVRDRLGRRTTIRAVDGCDLRLRRGEIAALVGESGSGKSTVARLLALACSLTEGEIRLGGELVSRAGSRSLRRRELKRYRGSVQVVRQDPFGRRSSLHRVRHVLARPLRLHRIASTAEDITRRSVGLLERVSLTPAQDILNAYPHELSDGQRQRLGLARALAVQPQVLLADEPISMPRTSIRLNILDLLAELRDTEQLAMLYLTQDIASARHVADTIQVLYAGQTVEGGPTDEIIDSPQHPYTRQLIDALSEGPLDDQRGSDATPNPPSGCRFRTRCRFAMDECGEQPPPRVSSDSGHWVRCWLYPASS